MDGKELWDHIEKIARVNYGKSENWKLTMVDLQGEDTARIRLNYGFDSVHGTLNYGLPKAIDPTAIAQAEGKIITEEMVNGNDCKNDSCS